MFVLVGVFFVVVIYPPISVCLTVTCLLSPALCAVSVVMLSHSLFYVLLSLSCLIGVSVDCLILSYLSRLSQLCPVSFDTVSLTENCLIHLPGGVCLDFSIMVICKRAS